MGDRRQPRRIARRAARALGVSEDLAALTRRVALLERKLKPGGTIINAIGDAIGRHLADFRKRFEDLERRQLRFLGIYESGRSYKANSLVVRRGGLWVALVDTTTTPGTGADWQLAVKSGEAEKAS
jgi:hypothetical protein